MQLHFLMKHLSQDICELELFVIFNILKMLGLYLYTLIIGHKSCNMLCILNKTLQKKLQTFVTNNVGVLTKKEQHNNNKTKNQTKIHAGAGN